MKKNFKPVFVLLFVIFLALLVGCASTKEAFVGTGELVYEDSYEIAGYKFLYKGYDDHLTFNYIDFFSDAEIEQFAGEIAASNSIVHSFAETAAGQVTFFFNAMPTQANFDAIEEAMNTMLGEYFY